MDNSVQPLSAFVDPQEQILLLSAELVAQYFASGLTVAVAESLTGGLVCDAIVATAGASEVFRGGIVAYANDVKVSSLGVNFELLERESAVAQEVAVQMAAGVAARLGTDVGLATTGVAGPGAQDGKPAGTVFIAAVRQSGEQLTQRLSLAGSRSEIRRDAALKCLALALRLR